MVRKKIQAQRHYAFEIARLYIFDTPEQISFSDKRQYWRQIGIPSSYSTHVRVCSLNVGCTVLSAWSGNGTTAIDTGKAFSQFFEEKNVQCKEAILRLAEVLVMKKSAIVSSHDSIKVFTRMCFVIKSWWVVIQCIVIPPASYFLHCHIAFWRRSSSC